ncbi:MAG: helix-turn-helix transcriptional regulator [Actinobacteria bacterium]|nr:helix-turn-helix transcriptional regulator [Actinomycetota bacterium]
MTSTDVSCGDEPCPVAATLSVLDGRWTILVVRDLLAGTRRFSELRRSLAGVSPKTLTDRLRALEGAGLVRRQIYAEVPPRVEYSLTERGRTLEPIIDAMAAWGRTAVTPAW